MLIKQLRCAMHPVLKRKHTSKVSCLTAVPGNPTLNSEEWKFTQRD
jgi:hypothetical protein